MKNLDQIKCTFSYSLMFFFYHYLFGNVGVILQDPTAKFKSVLGTDHFLQLLQRNGTVYRTILRKRMILISLRDSLRRIILKRPIATCL